MVRRKQNQNDALKNQRCPYVNVLIPKFSGTKLLAMTQLGVDCRNRYEKILNYSNPFELNIPFLCTLETPESLLFSDVFA